MSLCIAAAQSEAFAPAQWDDYAQRLAPSIHDAATAGAQLLEFPEYAALVLAAIGGAEYQDPREEVIALQRYRDAYLGLHRELAQRHQYLLRRRIPDDSVLAAGRFNQRGWVYADSDMEAVSFVRSNGQIFNHRHWLEQSRPAITAATVCRL